MHRKVAAALVAALALGIASCGDSESESLSRAQIAQQIELACREARRRAEARIRAARDDQGDFLAIIISTQRVMSERIDEIEPADSARSGFEALQTSMQERLELMERLDGLDGAELRRAMGEVEDRAEEVTARAREAARRLGIEDPCI